MAKVVILQNILYVSLMINVVFYLVMSLAMHPLHLGVVHFNLDNHATANIVIRLFSDDLMDAIDHENHGQKVFDCSDTILLNQGKKYVTQNFKLSQGSDHITFEFVHVKNVEDVVEFRLKAHFYSNNDLQICCTFFFEIFGDQTNLLLVKSPAVEDGFRLTSRKTCAHVKI